MDIPKTDITADQDSEKLENKELEGFLFKEDGTMVEKKESVMVENKEEMPDTLLDT